MKLPGTEEYYIAYASFGTPLSDYVGDKNVKGCHREVCLEKVSFDAAGYIKKITPTHKGIQEAVTANVQVVYKAEAGGKVRAGNGAAQAEVTAYPVSTTVGRLSAASDGLPHLDVRALYSSAVIFITVPCRGLDGRFAEIFVNLPPDKSSVIIG